MAQEDYTLANQAGLSFRQDLNNHLAAIVTNNSGATAPTSTFSFMWWADTTSGILKRRNAANNAWINFASLSTGLIIGTDVQAFDATILKDSDIGVNVQAYSALLADAVTSNSIGRKNYIINGDARVAQRGSVAAVGGVFTYGGADRFLVSVNALTSGTIQQITGGPSSGVSGFSQAVQATTSAADAVLFQTRLEGANTKNLNGETVTVTLKVFHDTGAAIDVTARLIKPTTTLDTFSATTSLAFTTVSVVSSTLTEISFSYTLGAAEASLGLGVQVSFATTSAVTGKYFTITDVQLEKGSVATDFEYRPVGEELALCQRYYEADIKCGWVGAPSTLSVSYGSIFRFSPKRVAPTLIYTGDLEVSFFPAGSPSLGQVSVSSFRAFKNASVASGQALWTSIIAANSEL